MSRTATIRETSPPVVCGEVSLDVAVRLAAVRPEELIEFAASACEAAAGTLSGTKRLTNQGRVDILITSDARMRALNRDFRGKDRTTDVLSFPAADCGDFALAGDIAISAGLARENARRFGHSLADELKILILHGMLHLAGHDHESDRGQMARVEARLRREFHLPAALIARNGQGSRRARRLPR